MKKILSFFYIVLFSVIVFEAKAKLYKIGDTLEEKFQFAKKFSLPLSDGKWQVVTRYTDSYYFITAKVVGIVKIDENNEFLESIEIGRVNLSGKEMGQIDNAVNSVIFKDRYDGCYERPEYYILEIYKRGSTHNCLVIRHLDTNKEIYSPDDPESTRAQIKKFIKENSIKIPPISFSSFHSYFSRLNRGEWYIIQYTANPKIYDSPEYKYFTEERSEFNKSNINRFPEHKKTMEKWLSIASLRHQYLEKLFKAKDKHMLNLDKYIQNDNVSIKLDDSDLVNQIKKLEELFKSGVLTEEEFKKAKEKILN
tara:strand:- start:460 stop:1386 length:927 start_codon:yes stop_codon:yes gene_type:complete